MRIIRRLSSDQRGGTLIEYALICGLIVIAILGGIQLFASKAVNQLNYVAGEVSKVS